jgi:hypothetical protein
MQTTPPIQTKPKKAAPHEFNSLKLIYTRKHKNR